MKTLNGKSSQLSGWGGTTPSCRTLTQGSIEWPEKPYVLPERAPPAGIEVWTGHGKEHALAGKKRSPCIFLFDNRWGQMAIESPESGRDRVTKEHMGFLRN